MSDDASAEGNASILTLQQSTKGYSSWTATLLRNAGHCLLVGTA